MNNLARKQSVRPNKQATVERHEQAKKRFWFTPGEKMLFLLFTLIICFMGAKVISTQTAVYEVNKEIQDIEKEIRKQQSVNHDLEVQVSEESTYERIWKRAKELGLNLSEQNVKVVQPK
ncbi:cell division protein FtsL [Bacillus sp. REN10]|uniref:cell division protein FtsL n=1 Tax=Bacillus sp. REN10 TaxID=2782541 RepID=UPI00193C0D37|nr:cell division protein FtsL [Bacillus sp. REN10]